jgi:beta-glucosidase
MVSRVSKQRIPAKRSLPAVGKEFLFGVGTAAYQVEGAWDEEGKGESIWDRFAHTPGKIARNENGDIACDHYHRYQEDIDIMHRIGVDAYRFSISWPRILPSGTGTVNQPGIDHYDRLVDALLEKSIEPFVTLYHWELPAALQDRGGWANQDSREWFLEYSNRVVRSLGDRVRYWTTLNEPWMFAFVGNLLGWHAPGKHNPWIAFRVLHNALCAHGLSVRMIRSEAPEAQVGLSLSLSPLRPASDSRQDRSAMETADLFMNRLLLDPLLADGYPEALRRKFWFCFPRTPEEDMEIIRTPVDFVGINSYTRETIRYDRWLPVLHFWSNVGDVPDTEFVQDGVQFTDMGYEVRPESLYSVLMRMKTDYGNPPVMITENGASFADRVTGTKVSDPLREAYISSYLTEALRARAEGVELRGYFLWTLLDNLEWAYGYTKRHGIVYVDFADGKRIVKDSATTYSRLIREARREIQ